MEEVRDVIVGLETPFSHTILKREYNHLRDWNMELNDGLSL